MHLPHSEHKYLGRCVFNWLSQESEASWRVKQVLGWQRSWTDGLEVDLTLISMASSIKMRWDNEIASQYFFSKGHLYLPCLEEFWKYSCTKTTAYKIATRLSHIVIQILIYNRVGLPYPQVPHWQGGWIMDAKTVRYRRPTVPRHFASQGTLTSSNFVIHTMVLEPVPWGYLGTDNCNCSSGFQSANMSKVSKANWINACPKQISLFKLACMILS